MTGFGETCSDISLNLIVDEDECKLAVKHFDKTYMGSEKFVSIGEPMSEEKKSVFIREPFSEEKNVFTGEPISEEKQISLY